MGVAWSRRSGPAGSGCGWLLSAEQVARLEADLGAWLCFQDESGQGLRPPKGRTWGRRGHTPGV